MSIPALELRAISKSYFGNPVLKAVDLAVAPGEIHALVGENGAGKSTLMNILFGMPVIHETGGYEGEIRLGGETVSLLAPSDAMAHGVGMVHQEFMLLPGFTITENIKLNRERTRANGLSRLLSPILRDAGRTLRSIDVATNRANSRKALDRIGMSLDETLPVAGLPVGHMQFVEIAREIDKENARVVVFDEPTAVLTESEAAELLEMMKTLAGQGTAILFISHRLDEILAVSDRITVLRDGEVVGQLHRRDATLETLAELMIGRTLEGVDHAATRDREHGEVVLAARDLAVDMPGEVVKRVSFDVRRGEIFGIAGLAGQGKIGIANGIMGLHPARGEVTFAGSNLPLDQPLEALRRGLAFVSEDRRQVGLLLDESIERNMTASAIQVQGRFLRGPGPLALADGGRVRAHAHDLIERFDIRCRGPAEVTRRLSGGNQQKVCLARAITLEPELLFVSEPTRGIDVGAKELVLDLLVKLNREQGTTIVLTSSELGELRRISDRIAVIDDGEVRGILHPDASDVEFGLLFGGESVAAGDGE